MLSCWAHVGRPSEYILITFDNLHRIYRIFRGTMQTERSWLVKNLEITFSLEVSGSGSTQTMTG